MTPLQLEIIFHYYTRSDDFREISTNDTINSQANDLAEIGLLYTPTTEKLYDLTEFGNKVVQDILNYFEEITTFKETKQ